MTKTKKQLRAEAVERLRKLEGKAASYADYCKAMVDCPDGFLGQVAVTQIIDLLTDDDANDDSTPEKVVSGSEPCVTPESCDSREKLEAEASELVAEYAASGDVCDALYHGMLGLLDRQAAITEREVEHDLMKAGRMAVEVERERIEELTAERDNWKANCEDWKKDCERYRSKFGKSLDYADAIHALMDEGMA